MTHNTRPSREKKSTVHREVTRRQLLEHTAVCSLAATATVVGASNVEVFGRQSASPVGPQLPVTTGRIRRVVTGHTAKGKSYVVSDEQIDVADMWRTTAEQPLGEGPVGERHSYARSNGESRCFIATIGPSPEPKPTRSNRIGFHVTSGIAYCFVLTGEIVFLVEEGEVRLTAGDLLVERGTDHSWRNEGEQPVGMFITVVRSEA